MPVNPTDEDLDRIYGRLGRPESPEGYGIKADGNIVTEDVAANFADVSHRLRLTPEQASGIMDYYRSSVEQSSEMSNQMAEEARENTVASLQQEWGRAYETKLEAAVKAVREIADPEPFIINLYDGSKLGDNPDFIKAFAKIADFRQTVTSEDTVSESPQAMVMTPKEAQAEVDAILNDRSHVYWDKSNPIGRDAAIKRVQELMEMIHG